MRGAPGTLEVQGWSFCFGAAPAQLLLVPSMAPWGQPRSSPPAEPGTAEPRGSNGCGRGRQRCPSAGDTPGCRDSGWGRGARTHLPEAVGRFLRGRCRLVVGARHGCGRQCGRWAAVGQTPASCTAGRPEARGWAGQPWPSCPWDKHPAEGTGMGTMPNSTATHRPFQCPHVSPTQCHPNPPELLCWERTAGVARRVSAARARLSTACPCVSPWGQWPWQGCGGGCAAQRNSPYIPPNLS